MPQLSDDMYCSQQIVVPPMFPYILRQYAKAAIRSQPSDLLRWSSTYFRCLSLNVPPPIKPRLEYPLSKDYEGVTPGWLRALMLAFAHSSHVEAKALWERWMGACQQHDLLVRMLCLGGFTDRTCISLVRFIALCVALLSDNLTQTMILLCEVVTEEPEGGSAMIPLATFIDVYRFLAAIDASKEQMLENRYFTDEAFDLILKAAPMKVAPPPKVQVHDVGEERSGEELHVEEEEVAKLEVRKETISCPDLTEEIVLATPSIGQMDAVDASRESLIDDAQRIKEASSAQQRRGTMSTDHPSMGEEAEEEEHDEEEELGMAEESIVIMPKSVAEEVVEVGVVEEAAAPDEEVELSDEMDNLPYDEVPADEIEKYLAREHEGHAETSTVSSTARDDDATRWSSVCADYDMADEEKRDAGIDEADEEDEETRTKFDVEDVRVEAVPGIGPVVPDDLVDAVVAFMKKCAAEQHGMVMPRNIRHYSCPPLHIDQH